MEIKRGIPVSPGVAIGPALVLDAEGFRIPMRLVSESAVVGELRRLDRALSQARNEAVAHQQLLADKLGPQYGAIFGAHAQMIGDPQLRQRIVELVEENHYSPEYAVSQVLRGYAQIFEAGGELIAERVSDIFDIEKRILRYLLGQQREELSHLRAPVIVLAHDLTPSETARLDPKLVLGFATEAGGRTSHTAIVARGIEIPAVVGIGKFLTGVSGCDTVIVDGNEGVVVLNPDAAMLARYQQTEREFRSFEQSLVPLRDLPAETRDGVRIALLGNIEFPWEVGHCLERGAEGIGLYRTEFLYIGAEREPSEQEHYEAYTGVVRAMHGRPVVIRSLDLGADKLSAGNGQDEERNPFLGLRSIRLCLHRTELFKTQIRAVLRASVHGPVSLMFPLVSTLMELRQAKMILADMMEDLREEGVPFDPALPVGIMVEVPSAVILANHFAREVAFFSLGTNDLTQYTLAVDRNNQTVANLYSPLDPAVLRLIRMVVRAARRGRIPLSMCGEMSGEPLYTVLLLGLGLRSLSVAPHTIPELKKIIRSVTIQECERIVRRVIAMDNARDVSNFLLDVARRIMPEVFH
jgi:phosphotransferase system enzyme I (PtsI)